MWWVPLTLPFHRWEGRSTSSMSNLPKITMKEPMFISGSLSPILLLLTIRLYYLFKNIGLSKIQQFPFPWVFSELFIHSFSPPSAVTQNKGSRGRLRMWGTPQGTNKNSKRCYLPLSPPGQATSWWMLGIREREDRPLGKEDPPSLIGAHTKRWEMGATAAAMISLGDRLSCDQCQAQLLWLLDCMEIPGIRGPRAMRRN